MPLSNPSVKKSWTQVVFFFNFTIGFVCMYNSCTIGKIIYIYFFILSKINVIIKITRTRTATALGNGIYWNGLNVATIASKINVTLKGVYLSISKLSQICFCGQI